MHEWIPVVCGALLQRTLDRRATRWMVASRVVVIAALTVVATAELARAPVALLLDTLLVLCGMVAARHLPRCWRALRARPVALSPQD